MSNRTTSPRTTADTFGFLLESRSVRGAECASGLHYLCRVLLFFFFQAEDGIRDYKVTGVQTCALPISAGLTGFVVVGFDRLASLGMRIDGQYMVYDSDYRGYGISTTSSIGSLALGPQEIGRASCRGRV